MEHFFLHCCGSSVFRIKPPINYLVHSSAVNENHCAWEFIRTIFVCIKAGLSPYLSGSVVWPNRYYRRENGLLAAAIYLVHIGYMSGSLSNRYKLRLINLFIMCLL